MSGAIVSMARPGVREARPEGRLQQQGTAAPSAASVVAAVRAERARAVEVKSPHTEGRAASLAVDWLHGIAKSGQGRFSHGDVRIQVEQSRIAEAPPADRVVGSNDWSSKAKALPKLSSGLFWSAE